MCDKHNDGLDYCVRSPDYTCYENGRPECCEQNEGIDCPRNPPRCNKFDDEGQEVQQKRVSVESLVFNYEASVHVNYNNPCPPTDPTRSTDLSHLEERVDTLSSSACIVKHITAGLGMGSGPASYFNATPYINSGTQSLYAFKIVNTGDAVKDSKVILKNSVTFIKNDFGKSISGEVHFKACF